MTPEQWAAYAACLTCGVASGSACRYVRPGDGITSGGAELVFPHPSRPLRATPDDAAHLLDDIVQTSVREGVTVRPGDTFVVRLDPDEFTSIDPERLNGELEAIREHLQLRLPRGCRVIVMAAGGQIGVVRHD